VEIYSLVGVSFLPKEMFYLPSGRSTIEVEAYPGEEIRKEEGNYAFEYQIKGTGTDIFKDQLTIKIVKLENVLEITPSGINYGDEEVMIRVRNSQNLKLEDATLSMHSVLFDGTRKISLKPFESINLSVSIRTGEITDLAAGAYVVSSELEVDGIEVEFEDSVSYREKQDIESKSTSKGLVIKTITIERINKGNLEVPDRISIKKNILTRLFTTFSVEPLITDREGLYVYYEWEKDLKPGESWNVDIKTNYTLPFILLLLIIFSGFAVYLYSRTSLVVRKRCSFVKTKGGEFALKVMLHVNARKSLDNIEIFDRIPMATKLYTKAGMPHNFDEKIGKLKWKIDRLNAGEERIFSYIIYSNIKIVGRLGLAPATAHFVQDGKSTYVKSNRTYFVSDIHPRY